MPGLTIPLVAIGRGMAENNNHNESQFPEQSGSTRCQGDDVPSLTSRHLEQRMTTKITS